MRRDKVLDEQVGQCFVDVVGEQALAARVREDCVQQLEGRLPSNRQPLPGLFNGFTRVRRNKVFDEQVGQQFVDVVGEQALVARVRENCVQEFE